MNCALQQRNTRDEAPSDIAAAAQQQQQEERLLAVAFSKWQLVADLKPGTPRTVAQFSAMLAPFRTALDAARLAFDGSGTRAGTPIVAHGGPVPPRRRHGRIAAGHPPPPTHAPPGNHSNASAALPADSDELPVVLADGVEVLATQLSTLALSFSLLLQCVTSIFLAQLADARGWRLRMLVVHVVLGAVCALALGLTPPDHRHCCSAAARDDLLRPRARVDVRQRLPPARRLAGAAADRLARRRRAGVGRRLRLPPRPVLDAPEAGAEADSLTTASMKRACALAALLARRRGAHLLALRGVAQPEPRDEAVGACTRLLRGIGRLQHHPHARGYLLSQTFYLAAASNDGATPRSSRSRCSTWRWARSRHHAVRRRRLNRRRVATLALAAVGAGPLPSC